MEEIAELIKNAMVLKRVERSGWKRTGMAKVESVAEHTFMLAFLAMVIGDALKMDVEKMMKMALLHDLAEAITGDITPHEMEKERKQEMENKAMEKLLENFEDYRNLWHEFMDGGSIEARMVREMDKAEMVIQAGEYAREYGVEKFMEFIEERNKVENPLLLSIINHFREPLR